MVDDEKPNNPFTILWNWLGVIGGILSLSSMAETWTSDLLQWSGFIGNVIGSYQAIVHPFFQYTLGWLPFDVPISLIDYIVLGIITTSSYFKVIPTLDRIGNRLGSDLLDHFVLACGIIICCSLWPYFLFLTICTFCMPKRSKLGDISDNVSKDKVMSGRILQWFGATILGFVVLLALNPFV